MRAQSWVQTGLALAICLVEVASAQQAGPLAGLDELLGKQKNMTIFRSYLKVRSLLISTSEMGTDRIVEISTSLSRCQSWRWHYSM